MKNATLESIAMQIAATEAQRRSLTDLIAERSRTRAQIESTIAAAARALDAATAALEPALTRDALGESQPGEVAAARAACADATKALATARKREGEAHELALAETGLAARAAPLVAVLAELRQQQADARAAAMVADLHARIDTYIASAAVTMRDFAEVIALDAHLASIGKAQDVRTPEVQQTCLPGFVGHPMTGPAWPDLVNAARLRIMAATAPL